MDCPELCRAVLGGETGDMEQRRSEQPTVLHHRGLDYQHYLEYLQLLIAWPPQVGCDVCCSAQARLISY